MIEEERKKLREAIYELNRVVASYLKLDKVVEWLSNKITKKDERK